MGDSCYSTVRCHRGAADLFTALGYEREEPQADEGEMATLVDEAAPYGNHEALARLGGAGVVFLAANDAGGDYGPSVYASDGDQFVWCETNKDFDPVASIGADGTLYGVEAGQQYWQVFRRARQLLERPAPDDSREAVYLASQAAGVSGTEGA